MTSIQKKLTRIIGISFLCMCVVIIVVNTILTGGYSAKKSRMTLFETCQKQSLIVNNALNLVEQTVQNILLFSEANRPDLEQFDDEKIMKDYSDSVCDVAVKIASNTEYTNAIYFRLNPELTKDGRTGFFWVKNLETKLFTETETTDLYKYSPDDFKYVGWYYEPVKAQKAIWMEPYYNVKLNVEVISYVLPIYEQGKLLGVIGMDVDFKEILDIIDKVDTFEHGEGSLLCPVNGQIYDVESNLFGQTIPEEISEKVSTVEAADDIVLKNSHGEEYMIAYETLRNHMKLAVYTPIGEINTARNRMIVLIILITLIFTVITMYVAVKFTSRIISPIKKITEATQRFAIGDWEVDLECHTNDELELLTDSIMIMADRTKHYIKDINAMAYRDALTGLKNKTHYVSYAANIQMQAEKEDIHYAIVVFDMNNLKKVNDKLGHKEGDDIIKAAGSIICKKFSHSPVFRIGGDEFVAIVDGEDYETCAKKVEEFCEEMAESAKTGDITELSVACGAAFYPAEAADFDSTFNLADERMYKNKIKLKNGDVPR